MLRGENVIATATAMALLLVVTDLKGKYSRPLNNTGVNPHITYSPSSVSVVPPNLQVQPVTDHVVLVFAIKSIHISVNPCSSNTHGSSISCSYNFLQFLCLASFDAAHFEP